MLGKDITEKMLSAKENTVIENKEMRIGGEGMRGFYDMMLPSFVNKYGKKWGVSVKDIRIDGIETPVHAIDITPEMKESVMEGQLMFAKRTKVKDENGIPFVFASNGSIDFGEIKNRQGMKDAPIRLSQGYHTIDENGKNRGYGLEHIKAQRLQQILGAGFKSAEDFVETVATNYTTVKKASRVIIEKLILLRLLISTIIHSILS